jgi:uncharacterized protein YbaR (Trm112 family)
MDAALLEILVCPIGKTPLREEGNVLVCTVCGAKFPFSREGYPNLVLEDAELPSGCRDVNDLVRRHQSAQKG